MLPKNRYNYLPKKDGKRKSPCCHLWGKLQQIKFQCQAPNTSHLGLGFDFFWFLFCFIFLPSGWLLKCISAFNKSTTLCQAMRRVMTKSNGQGITKLGQCNRDRKSLSPALCAPCHSPKQPVFNKGDLLVNKSQKWFNLSTRPECCL